jgi:HSP20 family molecular chaperone IbpA
MITSLDFFRDPFFGKKVDNLLSVFNDSWKNLLTDFDIKPLSESSFVDVNNHYELSVELDKEASAKNVNVEIEENVITVKYEYKTEKKSSSFTLAETLPENADVEKIEAKVIDGTLLITVGKVEGWDDKDAEEEDNVNVKVTKK